MVTNFNGKRGLEDNSQLAGNMPAIVNRNLALSCRE
jgi:hypothetical protein